MQSVLLVLTAYLLGSIPTGKIVGLLQHKDIQKLGSGNIGFANAVRVLGWPSGLVVLAIDITKAALPLYLAKLQFDASDNVQLVMGLAAIVGHAFPLWLKFRGGKSIATGFGVVMVLQPQIALLGLGVYCLAFGLTRVSGKGSLMGAWSLPVFGAVLRYEYALYLLVLALFASYTHRSNIYEYVRAKS